MLLYPVLIVLAFLVGYAIRRGSVCAVLATRALIVERRPARFQAFGVAATGAGAIILPLHWLYPESAMLSPGYPVTFTVILAGAAYGIGARLNNACVLGTLAHLTGGNFSYLATISGMITGAVAVAALNETHGSATPLTASPLNAPTAGAVLFLIALVALLAIGLRRRAPRLLRDLRNPGSLRMGPYRALLIVGICGSLLYALAGSWTYMSVLSHRAARLVDPELAADGWPALLCAMIVVAGGLSAAIIQRNFHPQWPDNATCIRRFLAGAMMGGSAAIVPGGNGTWLVYGLPSLAPHAICAYLSMTLTLCGLFAVQAGRLGSDRARRG